jgi:hypothetical protein
MSRSRGQSRVLIPSLFSDHKPLDQPGTSLSRWDVVCVRRYAAVVFIIVSLAVPLAGAAGPNGTRQAGPELNITGVDIANHSIPSRYGILPTLIDVKVEISETSLPGPKGEMAVGPRTIGFSVDPVSLAILVVAIIAVVSGVWYLIRRKPEETEEEDDESGE